MIYFRTSNNRIGMLLTCRTPEEAKIEIARQLDLQQEDVINITESEYDKLVRSS